MPVLKIDPISGESLDRAKTPEQILAEEAKNEKFYNERKKRVKSPKKKKKLEDIKEDSIVTINPILAQNTDPVVADMIEPFNKLLKECEAYLKTMSKQYKVKTPKNSSENHLILTRPKNSQNVLYKSDFTINEHIPIEIQYFSNYTTIPMECDVFNLGYKEVKYLLNVVVDRIWFKPLDVKQMLLHPKESKKALLNLITQMYNSMVNVKFLKTGNKYIGTTVADIEIINFKDEFVELRLWSDITEV